MRNAAILLIHSAAFGLPASTAYAQSARPKFTAITDTGVDVRNGASYLTSTDITAGSGNDPSDISLVRTMNSPYVTGYNSMYTSDSGFQQPFGIGGMSNFNIYLFSVCREYDEETNVCIDKFFVVNLGSSSYQFGSSAESYVSYDKDGSKLQSYAGYFLLTTKFGDRYKFPSTTTDGKLCRGSDCLFVTNITYANGNQQNFLYESIYKWSYPTRYQSRLKSVINNRGFGIRFEYIDNPPASNTDVSRALKSVFITKAETFARSCTNTCVDSVLSSSSYSYYFHPSVHYTRLSAFTNAEGKISNYLYMTDSYENLYGTLLSSVTKPGSSQVMFSNDFYPRSPTGSSPNAGKVRSHSDALGKTTYYSYLASETHVTDPNNNVVKYGFATTPPNARPIWIDDPLGTRTEYSYDIYGRLTQIKDPEGGVTSYTLDGNGNVIGSRRKPKAGFIASDLVSQSNYPACNSDNFRICNRPTYTIDAMNRRADFLWSIDHGGLLTETRGLNSAGSCVVSGGVCPAITYGYSSFTGTDGVSFYLPTSKQEKIDAGNSRITTWSYRDASGRFSIREQVEDSGGLGLRTCFSFDAIGNLISKTEPRAGLSACP